jgi:MoaA/NifB/PqqE/SkfB family radical SAM enzyme
MGWICRSCGNRVSFTEYNKVKTFVTQNPDLKISKIINTFEESPLLEVYCNKCKSKGIDWMEVDQPNNFLFDDERLVSEYHSIEALVFELTNKCDALCPYCPKNGEAELDLALIRKIIEENRLLKHPISYFELGWDMGNPMQHSKIGRVLELLKGYKVNIITNGRNFLSYSEGLDLTGCTVTFLLDSPIEELNDESMGQGCFQGTISALEMLKNKTQTGIYMRMNSSNYDKIAKMKQLADTYRSILTPTEIYPIGKSKPEMLMTDKMKMQVINDIKILNLNRTIHFSEAKPHSNCTYLRSKRMFIDASGRLSFCHFVSSLPNAPIVDAKPLCLLELIQRNNQVRNSFLRIKESKFASWSKPRETSSPCSYCLSSFGIKAIW